MLWEPGRITNVRLGPSKVWVAPVHRVKSLMIQSFGSGPNLDQYNLGQVALEGTNWSWAEAGFATENAWKLSVPPQRVWLPIEIPSGTPWVFDGTPSRLACHLDRFPRFIRLRETGTLAAGSFIDLAIYARLLGDE